MSNRANLVTTVGTLTFFLGSSSTCAAQESAGALFAGYGPTIILGLATLVLALIALVIIIAMFKGNMSNQVAAFLFEGGTEAQGGKPSVSRLQMLIWNFVVAFAFIYVLSGAAGVANIDDLLNEKVLILLGISNLTYVAGRMTSGSAPAAPAAEPAVSADRGGQPPDAPGPQGIA